MNRKQEILQAAIQSFTRFGYKATTVDHVAKIANVGKGTVYTFYENKQQLLQFAVKELIENMNLEADLMIKDQVDFMTNAHNALMKMLQFRDQHLLFAKLIEEEKQYATPEVKEMLGQIEQEIVSYVEKKIQSGIEKNEIVPCNSKQVAYLLLKAYKAFILDWESTYGGPLEEDAILDLFKLTIFKGLAKESEA